MGDRDASSAWEARCRALGGDPSREMFDELARGEEALPLLLEILARPEWRNRSSPELQEIPVHALRALGEIRSMKALPALLGVLADPGDHATHGQEAALAVARYGADAMAPVERMLFDRSRDAWARARAARALMHAALRDRRLRARVRGTYERLLRDPDERDRLLVSIVIDCASGLAMAVLLPAIREAYLAGRADEQWGDLATVELDILARRQRPDEDAKRLARRDVRELYAPLAERLASLDPETREVILRELQQS